MADTVLNSRRRVRLLLDDMNASDYAVDTERLTTLMESRMHFLAAEVGIGPDWVTGAVTLTANDYTYTLPTTFQYQRVMSIRLASQEWLLERVTHTQMLALKDGSTDATGDPTHYSLHEDSAQQVQIWLDPTPDQADTLDVMRSQVPSVLDADTDSIPFSDPMLRAFEMDCAAHGIAMMDDDERAKRKAVADNIPFWERSVGRLVRLERIRIGNLRRTGQIPWKLV